jgi:hypothetical protein
MNLKTEINVIIKKLMNKTKIIIRFESRFRLIFYIEHDMNFDEIYDDVELNIEELKTRHHIHLEIIRFDSNSNRFLSHRTQFDIDLSFRRFEIENNLRSKTRLIILFICLLILNIIIRISFIYVQRLSLLITSKLDY